MNGGRTRRALVWAVLAAALVGTVTGTSAAPANDRDPAVRDVDLVASANPSTQEPVRSDDAFAQVVSGRRVVKSGVTATGSAVCDGCDARSTALLVLYADRGQVARLDNTAAAWTQGCSDCTATALSAQVVVLRGTRLIVPNNRALAVNAACHACRATSAAFQVVVRTRQRDRLSGPSLAELRAWLEDQAASLQAPASVTPRAPRKKAHRRAQQAARSALGQLEDMVGGALDATTVSSDVEISR